MDNLFISNLTSDPFYYCAWVLTIVFSICAHEYAHAAMALKCGDDTAARLGHLSLNPLRQMGLTSIIMLALIGIAWGAVPVNPANLRTRGRAALVAFAGPGMNLLLCIVAGILAVICGQFISGPLPRFFLTAAIANGVLFLFNLLPVPMFDGWAVFSLLFPAMQKLAAQMAQWISMGFLILIFATPFGGLIWALGGKLAIALMLPWVYLAGLGH